MNYSFEYIDIILLAMIAGFIFLRLRGILGRKTGFEGKLSPQFEKKFQKVNIKSKQLSENFDEEAQKNFLHGAKIAYRRVVTKRRGDLAINTQLLLVKGERFQ